MVEPQHFQDRESLGALLPARGAGDLHDHGDVLEDGPALQELEVLEDDADPSPQLGDLGSGKGGDVHPVHQDLSRGGCLLSEQEAQESGLAGAAGSGEKDEIASLNIETDVHEGVVAAAVVFVDVIQLHHGRLCYEMRGEVFKEAEHPRAPGSGC